MFQAKFRMRAGLILIMLFQMSVHVSTAQSSMLDSLRKIIQSHDANATSTTDTSFVKTLNAFADELSYTWPDSAVVVAERAFELSTALEYPKGQLQAVINSVNSLEQLGLYLKAIDKLQQGITIAKVMDRKRILASFLSGAGKFYTYVGNYPEAINHALLSQRAAEEINSEIIMADNFNTLAMVYFYQDKTEESLANFEKCKTIVENLGDTATWVNVTTNIAEIYIKQKKYTEARAAFNQSLTISQQANLIYNVGLNLSGIAQLSIKQQLYDTALTYLQQAYHIQESLQDKAELSTILLDMGFCYFNLKQFEKSIDYTTRALQLAKDVNSLTNLRYGNRTLSAVYKAQGQFEKALFHHEQYKLYSDSVNNKESKDQTVRLEEEYKYDKKELQLKAANEESLTKRNLFIYVIATALVFTSLLIFLLIRNIRHRKQVNRVLKLNRNEIVRQNKELEAMDVFKNRLLSVVAHDVRGPLNSLKGMFYLFERNSLSEQETASMIKQLEGKVGQVSNFVDDLLLWARNQMTHAEANAIKFELAETITETLTLLKPIADTKKIKIQANLQQPVEVMADREMIKIVLRNLVTNAIKFSHANAVIRIESSVDVDRHVKVCVRDSGVGMGEEKLSALFVSPYLSSKGTGNEMGTGLGLLLCKQYIEMNNGTIGAESFQGNGSNFWFTLPLQ